MDKKSLESSIRDEAEQTISNIALRETEEIKKLNAVNTAEIDDFRKRIQDQTDARIRQESSKAENRTKLDLKKLKLKSIDAFITRSVEEAARVIRDNENYKKFLLDSIVDALGRIATKAEVRLQKEDLAFEADIRQALKAVSGNKEIIFSEDNAIKWGGCIIVDMSGGRIFDNTIERVYFRKSLLIRREVMNLLGDSPVDVE